MAHYHSNQNELKTPVYIELAMIMASTCQNRILPPLKLDYEALVYTWYINAVFYK